MRVVVIALMFVIVSLASSARPGPPPPPPVFDLDAPHVMTYAPGLKPGLAEDNFSTITYVDMVRDADGRHGIIYDVTGPSSHASISACTFPNVPGIQGCPGTVEIGPDPTIPIDNIVIKCEYTQELPTTYTLIFWYDTAPTVVWPNPLPTQQNGACLKQAQQACCFDLPIVTCDLPLLEWVEDFYADFARVELTFFNRPDDMLLAFHWGATDGEWKDKRGAFDPWSMCSPGFQMGQEHCTYFLPEQWIRESGYIAFTPIVDGAMVWHEPSIYYDCSRWDTCGTIRR